MGCALEFQPDIVAIRANTSGLNPSGSAWTTDLVSDLTGTVFFDADTDSVLFNFQAGTATENTDYKLIGNIQSDATFNRNVGDIIEDLAGGRPVRNFPTEISLPVYSYPDISYDSMLSDSATPTPAANNDTTVSGHFTNLKSFLSKCRQFDLLMGDTTNLVIVCAGRLSAQVAERILENPSLLTIGLQRMNVNQTQNYKVFTGLTLS